LTIHINLSVVTAMKLHRANIFMPIYDVTFMTPKSTVTSHKR
jgi:hypothetical protein